MADITRRRTGQLVRGLFEVLLKHPEGLRAKDALEQVAAIVPPTPFEASEYPERPGVRRYEKIIRFSTIAPVKAGWLAKSKGTWSLTGEGRKAFLQFQDPEQFAQEAGLRYRAWSAARPEADEESGASIDGAASGVAEVGTLEEAEEIAWSGIEEHLRQMPPYDFQELVAALLRAMGYHVTWIAPPGKDGGIDIVAHNDPLGTQDPQIKVQVKRRADKVNVDALRSFMALLGSHDVGIFVSVAGFTSDAEAEARSQRDRRVTLVHAERLVDLWIEHYGKIAESSLRLLPLRPIHYLAPE